MDEVRDPRSRGALVGLIAALAVALAGFVGLGAWQLHRMGWKRDLIARVERQLHAEPGPPPAAQRWAQLTPEADEYRRVRIRGHFQHDQATLVRASTALGTGYWVMTPLRSEDGLWVLVNRGFVPSNRELDNAAPADVELVGLLRFSEPGGSLLQANDAAQQRWYSRDVAAIAAARGLPADRTAPYFLDAVAEPAAPATEPAGASAETWPRAGLTVLHFSDNHLVYAITWFALAAMSACAIGYIVADESRLRQLAGERHLAHAGD